MCLINSAIVSKKILMNIVSFCIDKNMWPVKSTFSDDIHASQSNWPFIPALLHPQT
jgi:hypothetical protein